LAKQNEQIQQASARERAKEVLSLSIRSGKAASDTETRRLLAMQRDGILDKDADQSRIEDQADRVGSHVAALGILQIEPDRNVHEYLDQQISSVQHPGGPTHTALGDMRTYRGGGAAKKRANNTGLRDEEALHYPGGDMEWALRASELSFQNEQALIAERIRHSNQGASAPLEADGFSSQSRAPAFASDFASAKAAPCGISSAAGLRRQPLASMDTGVREFPFANQQGGSTVTPKHSSKHSEQEEKIETLKEKVVDAIMEMYMEVDKDSSEKTMLDTIMDGLEKEDHGMHKRLNTMIRTCSKKDKTVAETIDGLMKFV